MAIKRSSSAPTVDEYLSDDEKPASRAPRPERDQYENENENEFADASSFVQEGWAAASKAMKSSQNQQSTKKHSEFRFMQSAHLVKFLSSNPLVFDQHWVDAAKGRRSFICIGEEKGCPLCARGNVPSSKYGFRIVDLTDPDDLMAQVYIATPTAAAAIKEQHEGRSGPIDSGYWELSKTGEGKQSRTVVRPVKERDIAEDWDLDPESVVSELKSIKDPGMDILRYSTSEELREAANYC